MTKQPFCVRTFGILTVEENGAVLESLGAQRKALALLAVLAAAGDNGVARERLFALLWPDADDGQARNALGQLLFRVRRDTRGDAIIGSSELRLNDAVIAVDCTAFERAVAANQLAKAVEIYRGPFLDAFYLRGAPEFERWVEDERRRFADQYASALERLASDASDRGDARATAMWWKRRMEADPFSARVACAYAGALVESGDRQHAIQYLETHAALVRAELGVEPDAPVLVLLGQLRRQVPSIDHDDARFAANPSAAAPPAAADAAFASADIALPVMHTRNSRRWARGAATAGIAVVALLSATALTQRVRESMNTVRVDEFQVLGADSGLAGAGETIEREVLRAIGSSGHATADRADVAGSRLTCWLRLGADFCGAGFSVTGMVRRIGDSIGVFTTVESEAAGTQRALAPVILPAREELRLATQTGSIVAGGIAALSDARVPELAQLAELPSYDSYVRYKEIITSLSQAPADPWRQSYQPADAVPYMDSAQAASLVDLAERDTTFAAPRLLLLLGAEPPQRRMGRDWLVAHRARLSARDQAFVDALDARDRGDFEDWFRLANRLRDVAPDDPMVLREFAAAAYATNRFAAAVEASRKARGFADWQSDRRDNVMLEIDALHAMDDFDGAIRLWRELQRRDGNDLDICVTGVMQFAALGRSTQVDSLIDVCAATAERPADVRHYERRVRMTDELLRRAAREYLWHGYVQPGNAAAVRAFRIERQLYAQDTTANKGWLGSNIAGDYQTAYSLMRPEFGHAHCVRGEPARKECFPTPTTNWGVAAARVGDTTAAMVALHWVGDPPVDDSTYKVRRAIILLALGKRDEALRLLRDSWNGVVPDRALHANPHLRGERAVRALLAPRE